MRSELFLRQQIVRLAQESKEMAEAATSSQLGIYACEHSCMGTLRRGQDA